MYKSLAYYWSIMLKFFLSALKPLVGSEWRSQIQTQMGSSRSNHPPSHWQISPITIKTYPSFSPRSSLCTLYCRLWPHLHPQQHQPLHLHLHPSLCQSQSDTFRHASPWHCLQGPVLGDLIFITWQQWIVALQSGWAHEEAVQTQCRGHVHTMEFWHSSRNGWPAP